MAYALVNPGFESGNLNGWEFIGDFDGYSVTSTPGEVLSGSFALALSGGSPFISGRFRQSDIADISVDTLEPQIYNLGPATAGTGRSASQWAMRLGVEWYDNNNVLVDESIGPVVTAVGLQWRALRGSFSKPAFATRGRVFVDINKTTTFGLGSLVFDEASWNNEDSSVVTLTHPENNSEWGKGDNVPLAISYSGSPTVVGVTYYADSVPIATSSSAPFSSGHVFDEAGTYVITATATMSDGTTRSLGPSTITVSEEAPEPSDSREYKASNAYSYFVAEGFSGMSAMMPSTAKVLGVEAIVTYRLEVLSRTLNSASSDVNAANPNTLFDIVQQGNIEMDLLDRSDESYSAAGTAITGTIPVDRSDFTVTESGVSEGKRWTVHSSESKEVTIGGEEALFGVPPLSAFDFNNRVMGFRFVPQLGEKPDYAADGDAVIRIFIDRIRLRVYFDAGSPIYYFASPDKAEVIKGTLVAYCVFNGNFRTADASGVLQLLPELEVMDGETQSVGLDWTIHSAYPPNDTNYIGDVAEGADGSGMRYNGLPTQRDIVENRSRYEFITTNFYGDKNMNSFYGVHGLPRAFAYNKDFFYKSCTQPDPVKDSPRHIANHHEHLALGYDDGRVDLSVVGEPYNFDGAMGASSWATADPVTGLLPLPGMILGIFGEKSVTGLSGTTVDNFATQLISPKMGAIEYTIADMGFPVYANHYGIYTLSQVQQYGDFMGTPLSQDISPWLRPRLVRSYTKDEEVVCAWPVRSKNQYRLAFGDGAVLTMTINNGQQGSPTFSKQKYFKVPELEDEVECEVSYDMEAIVPIAVSSELSHTGEERIHMAPAIELPPPPPIPEHKMVVDLVYMYPAGEA